MSINYAEISQSATEVVAALGYRPASDEAVLAAVKTECDVHGDSMEVRNAVYDTVRMRLGHTAKIERVKRAIKSVREDDLPELDEPEHVFEPASVYYAEDVTEVYEVLGNTRDRRGGPKLGGDRSLLITSAEARLTSHSVCYTDERGRAVIVIKAMRREHSLLRLAGLKPVVA